MPDTRQAAGDHWLADLLFEQCHVGDGRPSRAGDENAVCIAALGVKTLGDFVRGMNRKIGELGIFPDTVSGNLQHLESRGFQMAFQSLIDLVLVGSADYELFDFHCLQSLDLRCQSGGHGHAEFLRQLLAHFAVCAKRKPGKQG